MIARTGADSNSDANTNAGTSVGPQGTNATAAPVRKAAAARRSGLRITHERVLMVVLILELALFGAIGSNFLTHANAGEIVRASAEIGLLALALTPVIITGGIDLSVGSLLGLCAVVLGVTWRDAGAPIGVAMIAAIGMGVVGGGVNALLIARGIPPLIVTLGTYSLFRGLAEGITGGVRNYSAFPGILLLLGQGDIVGVPAQVFILVLAAIAFWLLLHRMTIGRALRAIGFAPEGARYAGVNVTRSTAMVYVLSGGIAGIASLVYVSRLGQAKADAGTGFELMAITAVVLGGTSIFGGRGSIAGTLLGVAILGVLQTAELAGVLTAVLLILALGANKLFERPHA
jgi:ribose/xylose/arabinose/galactoside ABC-type transport system permease subunit